MDERIRSALRSLPSVDEALRAIEARANGGAAWPRWALTQALRDEIEALRRGLIDGEVKAAAIDEARVGARVERLIAPSLRPVHNATGVVLHTNLGRAPLGKRAMARVEEVAGGYSNLEYRLDERARGSRHVHAAALLCELCHAEDAAVVNNNAGAVFLCLTALASGREVVVSRGELIEIGGSFRLPDVMAASGAVLREVGTTNRTHLADYERAIGDDTALLMKAHRSNFALQGFTAEVDPGELAALAHARNVPAMFDLGSGTLIDLAPFGLPAEPTVPEAARWGFDLLTFSGDKLLGGPQAGIITGTREAVAQVKAHPLMRALRPDKMTLAALEATLEAYRDGAATRDLPALAMLSAPEPALEARAKRLRALLVEALAPAWTLELRRVESRVGGGSLPEAAPASWAVTLEHEARGPDAVEAMLRRADPPVLARIAGEELLLDVRTLPEESLAAVTASVQRALAANGGAP